MTKKHKNWFGMETHPTDNLIYWTNTEKEAKNLATSYRGCYDRIVDAGCLLELNTLMRASYEEGCDNTHEQYSEDL